ncbi:hypothetical protein HLV39_13700 [Marinobacter adhaerens]|uniref:Toxin CptA n=1 Tax=Marinobacter adhaerens TaxID=1033846 RepID=A0A851I084_9GAMM|nr:hypothetical protein [Marinobacter adhaerens]NWN92545.1 hypothetical protein [Marinobacter adhaerens]
MSSRTDLTLSPSTAAGCLAAAPWLATCAFALIAGAAGKHWMYLLALPTLVGATAQFRLNGLLKGATAVRALYQDQNTLFARLGNGRTIAVSPCSSSRISSKVVLLKLRPTASRYSTYPVVLLTGKRIAGNLPEDQFRRLRMWLRLGHTQQSLE